MNRRLAVKKIVIASGRVFPIFMLSISVSFFQDLEAQKPLYTSAFGIQTYTFRRSLPTNPEAVLDTIKMMGFTEVESGSGQLTPQEFRKLCDDRGISIPSTGGSYEQLENKVDSIIYKARILGSRFVSCAWIPHQGDFKLEDAKKAADLFNKAGKTLKENGLTFCYHAHGYEFQPHESGTLLDYLMNNTNPDYVSFEMDIFWIHFGGGDPAALLAKYGNRWKLMHLKDMRKGTKKDLTGGTSVENDVALGTGELNIPEILKQAKKAGIQHYFIEDESSSIITQVPQSVGYLKSLKE